MPGFRGMLVLLEMPFAFAAAVLGLRGSTWSAQHCEAALREVSRTCRGV